jgi:ribonuclease PH
VAAVSVGRVDGRTLLDLDYEEDVAADVDMNVVMTGSGRFVEVQGTGEEATFTRADLERLVGLASRGIRQLLTMQERAIRKRLAP